MHSNLVEIKLVENGIKPKRTTDGACAYDVYARRVEFLSDTEAKIYLGFKIDTSKLSSVTNMDWGSLLMPRSGWGTKHKFKLDNTVGLIDTDYRGEVIAFASWNTKPEDLDAGARVAQLAITPFYTGDLVIVPELSSSSRGESGFGSTGHG